MFFIPSYLKTNNDSYVRNKFNSMLDTLEKGLQDDFVEKLNSHDIPFNIVLLDKQQRIQQLAILSSSNITQSSLSAAEELLAKGQAIC